MNLPPLDQDLLVEELWDAPKAQIIAQLLESKNVLVLTGGVRESRLYDDLTYFTNAPILEFPAWETLPSEEIAPSPDIVGERYEVLRQVMGADKKVVLLAPLQSALQRLLPPAALQTAFRTLKVGEEHDFGEFVAHLEKAGFVRRPVVSDKGEFAVRGGIVDLFPVQLPDPYRIEFFGDEIESIRIIDPVGQTSVSRVDAVALTPAKEDLSSANHLASLLDYLGPETVLIFDDLVALEDRYVSLMSLPGAISRSFISFEAFLEEAKVLPKHYWTATPIEQLGEVQVQRDRVRFPIFDQTFEATRWSHPFHKVHDYFEGDALERGLARAASEEMVLEFVVEGDSDETHLKALLADTPLPARTSFKRGYLSSGYVVDGKAIVPTAELTNRHRVRRVKQRSTYSTPPSDFTQLTPGELVVHIDNGIGKYLGIERRKNVQGVENEYLSIGYADEGTLFVPLTQSHLISRYIGAHEDLPTLSKLGSNRWMRTRAVTEKAIRDYAAQLLKMHAERTVAGGIAYPPDGPDLAQFEADFPYLETPDQLAAIQAVKSDMSMPQPMDRLVCGDVGYGKTEVAMRAAFKAVEGGKQVVVLVPTTVLALQHFETFQERMGNFPVNVGVVSRFRSAKEIKATLEGVRQGSVDILIGTHKVLSPDVSFKDLGLVIIDEEQRFGVRVKEKIRAFKAGVDCLTLTATPIPRTLYISLMGARDLSVINTPPHDRLPIKTVLAEDEDPLIQSAILRELARDGQVFAIHNRVETIDLYAHRLQKLAPKARIIVGHGQMSADALDRVFHAFKSGEADILVATTIVENGIDIPMANTILIDRADRFGLAELYQLRGRVGRWIRRAYAYLLTPKRQSVPEIAQQRLDAIMAISGHGGGMKLAMRDLEIRGAGNILGTEQSGQVSRIGFNLYCRLLKQEIDRMQGKLVPLTETKIDFPHDGRIPESYIEEPCLRMEAYSRFGEANTISQVDALFDELRDRFGKPPKPVIWLRTLMRIRIHAGTRGITALKLNRATITIHRRKEQWSALIAPTASPAQLETQVVNALVR